MAPLSDRDRDYLLDFPIPHPLATIHGPATRPLVLNDAGFSNPPGDYDSWTAVTTLGVEYRVPVTVIEQATKANGGHLFFVELGPADPTERQRLWNTEMARLREQLNTIAAATLAAAS